MRRILVVEDDDSMRRHLCEIIKGLNRNVEVHTASNLKDAYELAMEHEIHLFLVDIILEPDNSGDVSGLRFVQEMRGVKRYEFIPIIFITSLQDPKLYTYSQLKCFEFIEKPFDERRVEKAISRALNFPVASDHDRFIFFKKDGITYSLCIEEIQYIDIIRRNLTVHCESGVFHVPYKTCKEMMKELGSTSFTKCNRFTIINKRHIEYVDYTRRYVKLKNVKRVFDIGPIMKNKFKKEMEEWSS